MVRVRKHDLKAGVQEPAAGGVVRCECGQRVAPCAAPAERANEDRVAERRAEGRAGAIAFCELPHDPHDLLAENQWTLALCSAAEACNEKRSRCVKLRHPAGASVDIFGNPFLARERSTPRGASTAVRLARGCTSRGLQRDADSGGCPGRGVRQRRLLNHCRGPGRTPRMLGRRSPLLGKECIGPGTRADCGSCTLRRRGGPKSASCRALSCQRLRPRCQRQVLRPPP